MDTHVDEMTLAVSEAAERVGLTAYTLRWYEQEGLVAPVRTGLGGASPLHREDVTWLVLLARMAELEEDLKVLNYKIEVCGRMERER